MIRRRHSSSTAPTTASPSRSLASVSRSRVKSRPITAASSATSRAAGSACAYPVGQHGAGLGPRVGRHRGRAGPVPSVGGARLVSGGRWTGGPLQQARPDRFDDEQRVAHRSPRTATPPPAGRARSRAPRRPARRTARGPAARASTSVTWPAERSARSISASSALPSTSSSRVRGDHEQRVIPAQVQQQLQPGEGVLVAPLEVVQHQQGGPPGRQHRPGQALEEPVPLPRVGHRARRGHRAGVRRRHEPVDLAGPHRVQPVAGRPQRRAAQPLRHRGQREPPAGGETAGAHGVEPGPLDQRGELVQQPALARRRPRR